MRSAGLRATVASRVPWSRCLRFLRESRDPHRQREHGVGGVPGVDPAFGCVPPGVQLPEAVDAAEDLLLGGAGLFRDVLNASTGAYVAGAGKITKTVTSARQLQFSLKYVF